MKSFKFFALASAMTSAALLATPQSYASGADVNAATSCGNPTTTIQPGVFIVRRNCDGSTVGGIGTTLDDAVTNSNAFVSLLSQGLRCNYSSLEPTPGTFNVDFSCNKTSSNGGGLSLGSRISGVGTTATDAGKNVLGFAQLYIASNGYRCSGAELDVLVGGFITNFSCGFPNPSGGLSLGEKVSGIGSTSTDAAENTLGFAELAASVQRRCTTSLRSVRLSGVTFEVDFNCGDIRVTGYGSTVTSAGRDALLQAQSF